MELVQPNPEEPQVEVPAFEPSLYGPSPDDVQRARAELEKIKTERGWLEPDRGDLTDPSIDWREGKPDYTLANLAYFQGKTKNHPAGSLELVVENLVKTWEMEASHKPFAQWGTINHAKYAVTANGGKEFIGEEAARVGNYNVLMSGCPRDVYDAESETFESSHAHFRGAFPNGFPWEVLEVFAGPPKVAFSWRHWADFTGEYQGNKGTGERVDMTGFAVVDVDDDLKIIRIEIYYDPVIFLEVLRGNKKAEELAKSGMVRGEALIKMAPGEGCPFKGATAQTAAA